MSRIFVGIYRYFDRRRPALFAVLAGVTGLLLHFSLKIQFDEQLTSFFPDDAGSGHSSAVFANLKAKDQIVVMFSVTEGYDTEDEQELLIDASETFRVALEEGPGGEYIKSILAGIDGQAIGRMVSMVYDNLPLYLTPEDYLHLDSLLTEGGIEQRMAQNHSMLTSAIGIGLKDVILQDPLGLGSRALANMQDFALEGKYEIYGGHIFSPDLSTLVMVVDPRFGMTDTRANENLVVAIEDAIEKVWSQYGGNITVEYFGGPSVAVYNARQIKRDTMVTLTIALLIIVVFITLVFRNKWAVPLIILPVVFGGIFSLGVMWLVGYGSMSAIAVGAGAAVFGIAMSYSMHVIAHGNHMDDPETVVKELAYPLTVGSFTTIGAFLGLVLTKSQLLRDFGVFSALALTGTTLFCLVFLPHLMSKGPVKPAGKILRAIEKANSYRFDRNKYLLWGIVILTVVSLFFCNKVGFDSDMMNLNYYPPHIEKAERRLEGLTGENVGTTLFIAAAADEDRAYGSYVRMNGLLDSLRAEGRIEGYSTAVNFLLPEREQQKRIARWESYWTEDKKQEVEVRIEQGAARAGFMPGAFRQFTRILEKKYEPGSLADLMSDGWLDQWAASADGITMLMAQVNLPGEHKEEVYRLFIGDGSFTVADRGYFANIMAQTVSDDFYLILFLCSFLIFGALLVSYGRIELALMAFLPMTVSWFIILGLMAVLGIEFNIVNIILSTFIFGIGDDFSIFIMDGLLNEYKDGKKLLPAHKTAIFFSAVTIVVGIGVLIFARHPALRSISAISLLGMAAVVLVAFTLQPVIFRLFISGRTKNGGFPFTLLSLLNTLYCFLYFVTGCFVLQIYILLLYLMPVGEKRRKYLFHRAIRFSTWLFLRTMFTTRRVHVNPYGETFEKPSVIIANHQSFIDILVLLSLYPKLVMVTNQWVWKSPFFGRVVRYAGFSSTQEGYQRLTEQLRPMVDEGYSIIVFPEGTRSPDNTIKRFHKGAFTLARELDLDILPVVLYGNGLVSSKRQPFYIKKGLLVSEILPRISSADTSYGITDRERTKNIAIYFRREYARVYDRYNRTCNPYFYDALIKNYTFKGPVLEWYMRIKVKLEKKYEFFDRIVPREGRIVDIGCGYGPLPFMLSMLSESRNITGIDYDSEKIMVARRSFLCGERTTFICGDASRYDLPRADVYILNDMLHYLDYPAQEKLLGQCFDKVLDGGKIIIRDGDSSERKRHSITKLTEKWSTRITGFNKAGSGLNFTSTDRLARIVEAYGFEMEVFENDKHTSNKIYIATRQRSRDE
ncbi:MAG: 1-acyl-sn-glycerol-3-phosphate acyltransferase [Rikenellaceae bacterium]|nr:1-acyl-sn-glycerol-3-phosphate acyltransferase [Rikenellaceae bacterium]